MKTVEILLEADSKIEIEDDPKNYQELIDPKNPDITGKIKNISRYDYPSQKFTNFLANKIKFDPANVPALAPDSASDEEKTAAKKQRVKYLHSINLIPVNTPVDVPSRGTRPTRYAYVIKVEMQDRRSDSKYLQFLKRIEKRKADLENAQEVDSKKLQAINNQLSSTTSLLNQHRRLFKNVTDIDPRLEIYYIFYSSNDDLSNDTLTINMLPILPLNTGIGSAGSTRKNYWMQLASDLKNTKGIDQIKPGDFSNLSKNTSITDPETAIRGTNNTDAENSYDPTYNPTQQEIDVINDQNEKLKNNIRSEKNITLTNISRLIRTQQGNSKTYFPKTKTEYLGHLLDVFINNPDSPGRIYPLKLTDTSKFTPLYKKTRIQGVNSITTDFTEVIHPIAFLTGNCQGNASDMAKKVFGATIQELRTKAVIRYPDKTNFALIDSEIYFPSDTGRGYNKLSISSKKEGQGSAFTSLALAWNEAQQLASTKWNNEIVKLINSDREYQAAWIVIKTGMSDSPRGIIDKSYSDAAVLLNLSDQDPVIERTNVINHFNNTPAFSELVIWMFNHSATVQVDTYVDEGSNKDDKPTVLNGIVATWPTQLAETVRIDYADTEKTKFKIKLMVNGRPVSFGESKIKDSATLDKKTVEINKNLTDYSGIRNPDSVGSLKQIPVYTADKDDFDPRIRTIIEPDANQKTVNLSQENQWRLAGRYNLSKSFSASKFLTNGNIKNILADRLLLMQLSEIDTVTDPRDYITDPNNPNGPKINNPNRNKKVELTPEMVKNSSESTLKQLVNGNDRQKVEAVEKILTGNDRTQAFEIGNWIAIGYIKYKHLLKTQRNEFFSIWQDIRNPTLKKVVPPQSSNQLPLTTTTTDKPVTGGRSQEQIQADINNYYQKLKQAVDPLIKGISRENQYWPRNLRELSKGSMQLIITELQKIVQNVNWRGKAADDAKASAQRILAFINAWNTKNQQLRQELASAPATVAPVDPQERQIQNIIALAQQQGKAQDQAKARQEIESLLGSGYSDEDIAYSLTETKSRIMRGIFSGKLSNRQ